MKSRIEESERPPGVEAEAAKFANKKSNAANLVEGAQKCKLKRRRFVDKKVFPFRRNGLVPSFSLEKRDKPTNWHRRLTRFAIGPNAEIFIVPALAGPWASSSALIDEMIFSIQGEPIWASIDWTKDEYPGAIEFLNRIETKIRPFTSGAVSFPSGEMRGATKAKLPDADEECEPAKVSHQAFTAEVSANGH
jgi:hypothetical protein